MSLVAIKQGSPEPDVSGAWWTFPQRKGALQQPEARGARATGHLSDFASMTPEQQAQHLTEDHHIPASLVRGYRREERGRTEVVGGYNRLHSGLHSESGKLSLPRRLGLTATPCLDKVLALAGRS